MSPCLSHKKWKKKVQRWIPPKFHEKKCQILRRTMRTLLQDLAQKSLKGLGTKACTNWEDRSANSLAYQVSNHSIFLYAVWLRLQSSHLMRATLHDFKGHSYASELKGWCFCIVSEHTGQGMFHLNENVHQQTLTSYFHLCVGWRGAQKMSHCHVRALLALSRVFLSFFLFCASATVW